MDNLLTHRQVGYPFRQTQRRRLAAILLGTPYGEASIIVDSIDTITRFSVCSLKEDTYGNVQRDLKRIILAYTTTIINIENLRSNLPLHWTDVQGVKGSPEAEVLLAALRGGLQELLDAFEKFSTELRLSRAEVKQARSAATAPQASSSQALGHGDLKAQDSRREHNGGPEKQGLTNYATSEEQVSARSRPHRAEGEARRRYPEMQEHRR